MKSSTSAQPPTLEKRFLLHSQQVESATRVKDWYSVVYSEMQRTTVNRQESHPRTFTATARTPAQRPATALQAESELGRRLRAARAKIVASGARLLDWDEIEDEIAERRGER